MVLITSLIGAGLLAWTAVTCYVAFCIGRWAERRSRP